MNISDLRRSRLRAWLDTHPTPSREKSYFSQLVNGTASFGEKAARRIEHQYGMAPGYLDNAEGISGATVGFREKTPASPLPDHGAVEDHVETIKGLLPRLTETQKAEIAATMQSMADKNDRLLRELLARDKKPVR
jgi:hypothetical protein